MDMANKILIMLVVILAILLYAFFTIPQPRITERLKQFSSMDEMKAFLAENSGTYAGNARELTAVSGAKSGATEYSTTNIQVEGVDEADIVKNDGKYIYTVSGKKVVIADAYPADAMRVVSEIDVNKSVSEIYLNGDKLVVFARGYDTAYVAGVGCLLPEGCVPSEYMVYVYIYDVTDRTNPVLKDTVMMDGSYMDSRMIGSYVYVVSSKYVNSNNPILPLYRVDGVEKRVTLGDIYYYDSPDSLFNFNIVSSIDLQNGNTNVKVYMIGTSYQMYVSQNNIYLTGTKYLSQKVVAERLVNDIFVPVLPAGKANEVRAKMNTNASYWEKMNDVTNIVQDYSNSLTGDAKATFDAELLNKTQQFYISIEKEMQKTVVHKISISGGAIDYKSSGEVPGTVLNQFSMDEYNGNFRITTTTGNVRGGSSLNHLYVLNDELDIIGRVEDLAKGERIYSTRFIGNRAYVVTFKKVDPLFVIDLTTPTSPAVLGYLKITGYSDYLHPYDETHIIGIGKEAQGGDEHFTWYQGLKVSLFDVSDVANPTEIGKMEIGDRGTDSYALRDHHAFLFDKSRGLLIIPVSLAEINESRYSGTVPDNAYGEHVWQGAYVLNVGLDGITLRGRITHNNDTTQWWDDSTNVRRSLYMNDVLYTVSDKLIKANNIQTVEEVNSVALPYESAYRYYYYGTI